jgi:hypothetical protein
MTWTNVWAGGDFVIKNAGGEENINMDDIISNEWTKTLICQAVSCNTIGTTKDAGATEKAMLKFIKRCECDYEKMRD